MTILAGDIGGTHARLALYTLHETRLVQTRHEIYPSRSHSNFQEVLRDFTRGGTDKIEAACFGIAGPVIDNQVTVSNLPWVIQRNSLVEILNTRSVWLLNDLAAASHGIDELEENDFVELTPGRTGHGTRAVLFAGTGLGEALSVWHGGRYIPTPSEGGHCDFSPRDAAEMEFSEFLSRKFGHVSWERILSGHGIVNLYQFLQTKKHTPEPAWLSKELKGPDSAIAIMRSARRGDSLTSWRVRDSFIRLLGREAGNLALKGLATGGVYLGGGTLVELAELLKGPQFLEEFSSKGRMSGLLSSIPVRVILRDDVGLLGSARFAAVSNQDQHGRKAA